MPAGLMLPQLFAAHPGPPSVQPTAVLGLPAEAMVAWKDCCDPSSTVMFCGARTTAMSLVIATVAVADFVGSATLVAVTVTAVGAGNT
jgi:hypothetical protein